MFRKRFFISGGVYVILTGRGRERFLNIAAGNRLMIFGVRELDADRIAFFTTPEEFKRMKPAARKAGVRLSIKEKYGLPFFLHRNRNRKLMLAGIFTFFILLYVLSLFIWDISIDGNYRFTDEMLLHYMSTLPVSCGMRKKEISCEGLEEMIRNHFPDILWVSAEIKGTRLCIRIRENENQTPVRPGEKEPCDLVAGKAGTVTGCVVRKGFCLVKAGDEVTEGELLVDGTIPIYDDSETLVTVHEQPADAEIFAKTQYHFRTELPDTYPVRARTGRIRRGFTFCVFDMPFTFLLPGSGSWEIVSEKRQLKLFEDFYLPIYFGTIHAFEYVSYEKNYTKTEAEAIKETNIRTYMENLSEKGIQIIGNDGKIEKSESGWILEETIHVIENIASPVPIQEKHEEKQTVNECN